MGYKAGMTHIVRDVNRPGSSELEYIIIILVFCSYNNFMQLKL